MIISNKNSTFSTDYFWKHGINWLETMMNHPYCWKLYLFDSCKEEWILRLRKIKSNIREHTVICISLYINTILSKCMTTMLYAFIDSIISLLRIYDIIKLKENCNKRMLIIYNQSIQVSLSFASYYAYYPELYYIAHLLLHF